MVHVMGYSQGGFASWNLLCLASDVVCSVAPLEASTDKWDGGSNQARAFGGYFGPFLGCWGPFGGCLRASIDKWDCGSNQANARACAR